MRKQSIVLAVVMAAGAVAGSAHAQGDPRQSAPAAATAVATGVTAEQLARLAEKLQLIGETMRAVDSDTRTAASLEQRHWVLESLYRMSLEQVRTVGVPGTYAATADAIARAERIAPKAIGSQAADLTYTPFTPCRYIDTRNVGGKILGARGYDLAASGTSYGGVAACSPIAILAIGDENLIGGLAFNMTIVDTSAAASPGFATVRPAGSTNTTALVNWTTSSAAFQLGNAATVSTDQGGLSNEFEIYTSGSVHAIVDLFGAFIVPQATALGCSNQTALKAIPTGTFGEIQSAACPAGTTITGGSCGWQNAGVGVTGVSKTINSSEVINGNAWICGGANNYGADRDLVVKAICCKVPGR